ncbi:hypothetical protein CAPTEDRAFT_152738 [Capitella teleta]|uniref:C2H2-type domain-containing protein n=1 Tax=Capitella teleta TaxID=283909 RepID=R7V6T9_CAPTE|nr:hypothetical protein CAPTEDRAFT_152738 [Capitella teleta]|eukprot:ELU11485.1 hypothetical protein CAPTEDRAFT_152738 [Capitella teleta]
MSAKSDFDSPAAVELILPANIIETCHLSSPGVKVEFITTNMQGNYVNHVSVLKLRDLSIRLTVVVLPIREGDENRPEYLMIEGQVNADEEARLNSEETVAFVDTLIDSESSDTKSVSMETSEDFYGPLETEQIMSDANLLKSAQKHFCTLCASHFDKRKLLNEHMSTVHSSKPKDAFKCSLCQKGFSNPRYLNSHITSSHSQPSHVCSICGKAFRVACNLRRHAQLVHHKNQVQKVQCRDCGKLFSQKSNLRQHVKEVHLMEYPYNCRVCRAGFHTKNALHKHMQRLHANVSLSKSYVAKEEDNVITVTIHKSDHTVS